MKGRIPNEQLIASSGGTALVKKVDNINTPRQAERTERENVRISEDLVHNQKVFMSDLFQSEYLILDNRAYQVSVDSGVLENFASITNISKINNTYHVREVNDFYILQLMVLEHDFKLLYKQKEKFFQNSITTDSQGLSEEKNIVNDSTVAKLYQKSSDENISACADNPGEMAHESQFVNKVIKEFDKIFNEENKRVERYYDEDKGRKKSSLVSNKKRNTVEKNYVEWKGRDSQSGWAESLRGGSVERATRPRIDMDINVNLNVNEIASATKNKIRSSIRNMDEAFEMEQIQKKESQNPGGDTINLGEIYQNRVKRYSGEKEAIDFKKLMKKDEAVRE